MEVLSSQSNTQQYNIISYLYAFSNSRRKLAEYTESGHPAFAEEMLMLRFAYFEWNKIFTISCQDSATHERMLFTGLYHEEEKNAAYSNLDVAAVDVVMSVVFFD